MPSLKLPLVVVILILVLGIVAAMAQSPKANPLTSVAIDPGLFRDGAIQRYTGTHESWSYVCDEIAKMKKRFCSLRSQILGPDGKTIAAITISTGEDGRPAALLAIAGSSFNETGIEVSTIPNLETEKRAAKPKLGMNKPNPPPVTRLYPAACENNICQLVWTLPQDHIAALSSGLGLRLRFTTPTPGVSQLASALLARSTGIVEATIEAKGFATAVNASVKMAE